MARPLPDTRGDSVTLSTDGSVTGAPRLPSIGPALVMAWLEGAPDRVGEALWVTGPSVFGRGGARSTDPLPRAGLVRVRPGSNEPRPPLADRSLSRDQLVVEPAADGFLLRNTGRAGLVVDGRPVDVATVVPGSVVELGARLAFVCARMERSLPPVGLPLHPWGAPDPWGLVGEGAAIWELRRSVAFAATRGVHVLVRGPSGTGKELVGRALHAASGRRGPFVSRNAATLPEGLVDAELFGHAAGYPQAGMPARDGLVGAADGGTLFLDEFAELPLALQPRLLRVLDDGELQRLGETRVRRVDLRLVAATNRPDADLRADLRARFPLCVEVPALDARREDLPLLLAHLLGRILRDQPDLGARFLGPHGPRVSLRLVRSILTRTTPTNVRDLHAWIWSALAASRGDRVEPPAQAELEGAQDPAEPGVPWERWRGADPDRIPAQVVQAALDAHNGVQGATSEALGLTSRHVLARIIRRHGLIVRRRG